MITCALRLTARPLPPPGPGGFARAVKHLTAYPARWRLDHDVYGFPVELWANRTAEKPGETTQAERGCQDDGAGDGAELHMIVLYNPKATKFRNRRFPLSILSIGGGSGRA